MQMAAPSAADPLAGLDSDDDFAYEEVEVASDDDDDDIVSEDLESALKSLQALTVKKDGGEKPAAKAQDSLAPGQVARRMEVLDDFIRNFFVKMGLSRTSEVFESEWYELKATGKLQGESMPVPDVYLHNVELEDQVRQLTDELAEARTIASKASSTWDKFRKERDFHRMHHKRVAQEKNRLITDLKRLKEHYSKYEPTILELKRKYEAAMKEKMLITLERDKVAAKAEQLESTQKAVGGAERLTATITTAARTASTETPPAGTSRTATSDRTTSGTAAASTGKKTTWSPLPSQPRRNPYDEVEFAPVQANTFGLQKTFKGHLLSVANLVLHPTKPIVVTASDDKTWKMWHLPNGDLIMSGEGHKDWVAGVDFHPRGMCLASGSGDSTVKLWDFERQSCVQTFTDHTQAVWGVKFHDLGDYLASCSLDHSVRLWDINVGKCRQALRGHVDSVNDICWQPFTTNIATASSDKTVSVWDARAGLCVQTFYGHQNSCNACTFNLVGTTVASTDADGILKLWDVRMVAEIMTVNTSKFPANSCEFDRSGQVLVIGCDDSKIRCFNAVNGELMSELTGHEDAVHAAAVDPNGQYIVSAASDHTFRLWA